MRMLIGGLQKTTLLDFPGCVSAVVFTRGCNFNCPYCHNGELLGSGTSLSVSEVLEFLQARSKVLQGVVISGGEPTLQPDLPDFCLQLRLLGYRIKLDTNGSRLEPLDLLLREKLVDYVAMDVKAIPGEYPEDICGSGIADALLQSVRLLKKSGVAHEFRVTCAAPFISRETFPKILAAIKGATRIALQEIRLETVLDADFFASRGRALTRNEIEELQSLAIQNGENCIMR